MNAVLSSSGFDEQFGDIMLNGLDSKGTYIILRQNKRRGINIGIRPFITRVNPNVVLLGGKLRVGYTLDDNHQPVKVKVVDLHEKDAVLNLRDYCKGFSWLRESRRRFSTILGIGVAASCYDGDAALAAIEANEVAADFIGRVERQYKQYNDGIGFKNKTKVIAALAAAWSMQLPSNFIPLPSATQLPDVVVGKQSKLLNQAQENYGKNVVSFTDKVAAIAAQSAETQGAAEEDVE